MTAASLTYTDSVRRNVSDSPSNNSTLQLWSVPIPSVIKKNIDASVSQTEACAQQSDVTGWQDPISVGDASQSHYPEADRDRSYIAWIEVGGNEAQKELDCGERRYELGEVCHKPRLNPTLAHCTHSPRMPQLSLCQCESEPRI